ncbi:MAG: hypothetical protein NC241_01850 [Bacteroides sp.]|nr:hypothetical protein [Bacteroides sp.]MCM1457153.1 hypothetical protein [Lachnoclostridium sp.]
MKMNNLIKSRCRDARLVRPQKPIGAEICTPGCGRATVFQVTPGFSRGDNLLTIPGVAEPHSINAGAASHGKAVTLDVSPVCRLRRARFVKFESKFDFGLLK